MRGGSGSGRSVGRLGVHRWIAFMQNKIGVPASVRGERLPTRRRRRGQSHLPLGRPGSDTSTYQRRPSHPSSARFGILASFFWSREQSVRVVLYVRTRIHVAPPRTLPYRTAITPYHTASAPHHARMVGVRASVGER